MLKSIIAIIIGVGLIVASIFYLVPTSQGKSNGYTNTINSTSNFFHNNWLWVILVVLAIILVAIAIYLATIQRKI